MSLKEFVIWGVPPNEEHENVLYTKATSLQEAIKISETLEKKHGCTNTRIQILDLSTPPDFSKIFKKSIWKVKPIMLN